MLTQERLKELFCYNPDDGIFTVKSTGNPVISGSGHRGKTLYQKILIDKKIYPAHRLAWLYVYGVWPEDQIDHIDGNGLNNKIDNLRCVSQSQNLRNSTIRANNSSGVNGVTWNKKYEVWRAYISTDAGRVQLGSFKEFDDAVAARKNAEKLHGYHENHGRARKFIESPKTLKKRAMKAIVRIDRAGFANIISNGSLFGRRLFNLKKCIDGYNTKILVDMSGGLLKSKMKPCEICKDLFYPSKENHVVCSDRCRTKKYRDGKLVKACNTQDQSGR